MIPVPIKTIYGMGTFIEFKTVPQRPPVYVVDLLIKDEIKRFEFCSDVFELITNKVNNNKDKNYELRPCT